MTRTITSLPSALSFATAAHDGQVRKYTGEPYIWHPMSVSGTLALSHPQSSKAMIDAALLHDVVEDTPVTLDQILSVFGEETASLVGWLTDVSDKQDGNRAQRKAIDRAHTHQAPVQAQIIKCADLLDNSQSILKHDPNFAVVFLGEKRLLLDGMRAETKVSHLWKMADRVCTSGLLEAC